MKVASVLLVLAGLFMFFQGMEISSLDPNRDMMMYVGGGSFALGMILGGLDALGDKLKK